MPPSIRATIPFAHVDEHLCARYAEAKNEPENDPLGGVIATILSQHTSDLHAERAYQQLGTAFPPWQSVRDAATDKRLMSTFGDR